MIFFYHLTSTFILINQLMIVNILIPCHEQSYCIMKILLYVILLNLGNVPQIIIMK